MTRRPVVNMAPIPTVRVVAYGFAVFFVLLGILGFIPGVTIEYQDLEFAGADSEALLLGVFQVSVLHNLVHLAFGVAGMALARTAGSARVYLVVGGIVYAALWIYGLFVHGESRANFASINIADNWLHFLLAVSMIVTGVVFGRSSDRVAPENAH